MRCRWTRSLSSLSAASTVSSARLRRVCIVGSGPAGFYAAKYLADKGVRVDLLEKLPVPFGLVRYGVAPDHPEVKSVESTFAKVAAEGNVRFFGNVAVGSEALPLAALRRAYDGVILAYGASTDRPLGLGEGAYSNVVSARQFVNWYNGYPDHAWAPDLSAIESVVIVGNGNVALDCARILAKRPEDLAATDIAAGALAELRRSAVRRVSVVGRRGAAQASFTIKELRELTRLAGVRCRLSADELALSLNAASEQEVRESRPRTRIIELLQSIAGAADQGHGESKEGVGDAGEKEEEELEEVCREVDLRFLLRPTALQAHLSYPSRVAAVVLARTALSGEAHAQAVAAAQPPSTVTLPCQLVLASVGYQSQAMEGAPFCERTHTVPNVQGRVLGCPGLYAVGWLKRGPTGIIASAVGDAKETVAAVLADLETEASAYTGSTSIGRGGPSSGRDGRQGDVDPVAALAALRAPGVVTWADFLRLDAHERASGGPKPREKSVSVAEMLRLAKGGV